MSINSAKFGPENLLEIVESTIDEDHEDESPAETIGRRNGVPRGDNSPNCESEERTYCRDQVGWSSSDPVNLERHEDVHNQRPGLETAINTELRLRVCDTHVIHDRREEVRHQSITGPL